MSPNSLISKLTRLRCSGNSFAQNRVSAALDVHAFHADRLLGLGPVFLQRAHLRQVAAAETGHRTLVGFPEWIATSVRHLREHRRHRHMRGRYLRDKHGFDCITRFQFRQDAGGHIAILLTGFAQCV